MSSFDSKPPVWYWIVSVIFLLWGLAGCFSLYMFITVGPTMNATPDAWEQAYAKTIPAWYVWVYVVAVGGGLLGALALLARTRVASLLTAASILGIIVQFGYVFFATDLIAHKGMGVVGFPIFILVMALFQYAVAMKAGVNGWLK